MRILNRTGSVIIVDFLHETVRYAHLHRDVAVQLIREAGRLFCHSCGEWFRIKKSKTLIVIER